MQTQTHTDEKHDEQATIRSWLADAREVGEATTYTGKRSRIRVTWNVPLTVEILDGERAGQTEFAAGRNISEGCMGLRCRRPIPVWTSVRIMVDEEERRVHARVMQCTATLGAFVIGVEFEPRS